jgi:hypothetical protein
MAPVRLGAVGPLPARQPAPACSVPPCAARPARPARGGLLTTTRGCPAQPARRGAAPFPTRDLPRSPRRARCCPVRPCYLRSARCGPTQPSCLCSAPCGPTWPRCVRNALGPRRVPTTCTVRSASTRLHARFPGAWCGPTQLVAARRPRRDVVVRRLPGAVPSHARRLGTVRRARDA